jgi:hypothetical protein
MEGSMMFNTSDETAEITKALVTAQLEMPAAVSNKRGYEKHQSNDVSGKKPRVYADINAVLRAVRPTLSKHGIAIVQGASVSVSDAACTLVSVVTRLSHTSGEWMESTCYIKAKDASAWSIGSAITYARRYGLVSMTGCVCAGETIDDDAEDAQFGVKDDGTSVTLKRPKGYEAWQKSLLNMTSAKDLAKAFKDPKTSPPDFRQFLAATQEPWFTDHRTKLEANDADV